MTTVESELLERADEMNHEIEVLSERLIAARAENVKLKQTLEDYRCGRIFNPNAIDVEALKAELKFWKSTAEQRAKELKAWRTGALKHDRP
jgi:hypothetical protein